MLSRAARKMAASAQHQLEGRGCWDVRRWQWGWEALPWTSEVFGHLYNIAIIGVFGHHIHLLCLQIHINLNTPLRYTPIYNRCPNTPLTFVSYGCPNTSVDQ